MHAVVERPQRSDVPGFKRVVAGRIHDGCGGGGSCLRSAAPMDRPKVSTPGRGKRR